MKGHGKAMGDLKKSSQAKYLKNRKLTHVYIVYATYLSQKVLVFQEDKFKIN